MTIKSASTKVYLTAPGPKEMGHPPLCYNLGFNMLFLKNSINTSHFIELG